MQINGRIIPQDQHTHVQVKILKWRTSWKTQNYLGRNVLSAWPGPTFSDGNL